MRHRVSVKKLSKTPAHRKAMLRNMLIALYRHEKIKTTHAKSKVLQSKAERLITRAKQDTVHNRRMVRKWVQDKDILNKLFTDIGPRYKEREGGYTRIVKIGPRYGDASEMVYILLVEEALTKKKTKQKTSQVVDEKPKAKKEKKPNEKPNEKPESKPDEPKAAKVDDDAVAPKEEENISKNTAPEKEDTPTPTEVPQTDAETKTEETKTDE